MSQKSKNNLGQREQFLHCEEGDGTLPEDPKVRTVDPTKMKTEFQSDTKKILTNEKENRRAIFPWQRRTLPALGELREWIYSQFIIDNVVKNA